MPEGERAFADSKGPRTVVTARVSVEADIALRLAAAEVGLSKSAYATFLYETWAQEFLNARAPENGGAP